MTAYADDRAIWADEQAGLLRGQKGARVDRENIATQIESLGAADIQRLRERIRILLTALIRWAYNADIRSAALLSTIMWQRNEITNLLDESPSLVEVAKELMTEVYADARHAAAIENGPFEDAFPVGSPFLPAEVLDRDFLPDPYGDDQIRGAAWWRTR